MSVQHGTPETSKFSCTKNTFHIHTKDHIHSESIAVFLFNPLRVGTFWMEVEDEKASDKHQKRACPTLSYGSKATKKSINT
jgi:hypothetical protein